MKRGIELAALVDNFMGIYLTFVVALFFLLHYFF